MAGGTEDILNNYTPPETSTSGGSDLESYYAARRQRRQERRKTRLFSRSPAGKAQTVAEVESLRGGPALDAPVEQQPAREFGSTQEVIDYFKDLDAHREATGSQLEETKKYLDSVEVNPRNAADLKAAYKKYYSDSEAYQKDSASLDEAASKFSKEMSAARQQEEAGGPPDKAWWQKGIAALGYTFQIPGAALGELGDLVGKLTDSKGDAQAREAINEGVMKRAYNPKEGAVGNLFNYIREKGSATTGAAGTLYAEGRRKYDPTSGTWADPAQTIALGTNAFTGAKPYMRGKELAEGGYMDSHNVDAFIGDTALSLAIDPTSYMGTGLYSRALAKTGALTGLGAVERTGAKALLLKEGSVTRGALETAARARALELNPEIRAAMSAEDAARFVKAEPVGNALKPADLAALNRSVEAGRETFTTLAKTPGGRYLHDLEKTLAPYVADEGISASLEGARKAGPLAEQAGAKSPVVAETLREQVELQQRVAGWKPVFAAYDAFEKQFPKVAAVGTWVRDSFISRVPFGGPVARAWGASKGQAAAETGELFTALGQFKDELAEKLAPLKQWERDEVLTAGRELVEQPGHVPLLNVRHTRIAKDVAEIFHDATEYAKDFEKSFGIDAAELTDDVISGWWSHSYSDDFRRVLADNPALREKMGAELDGASRAAWRVPEDASRKLREMTFDEVEDFLRKKGGLPAGTPILERNPEKVLGSRYAFAGKRIERARQIDAVVKEFGAPGDAAAAHGAINAAETGREARRIKQGQDALDKLVKLREASGGFMEGKKAVGAATSAEGTRFTRAQNLAERVANARKQIDDLSRLSADARASSKAQAGLEQAKREFKQADEAFQTSEEAVQALTQLRSARRVLGTARAAKGSVAARMEAEKFLRDNAEVIKAAHDLVDAAKVSAKDARKVIRGVEGYKVRAKAFAIYRESQLLAADIERRQLVHGLEEASTHASQLRAAGKLPADAEKRLAEISAKARASEDEYAKTLEEWAATMEDGEALAGAPRTPPVSPLRQNIAALRDWFRSHYPQRLQSLADSETVKSVRQLSRLEYAENYLTNPSIARTLAGRVRSARAAFEKVPSFTPLHALDDDARAAVVLHALDEAGLGAAKGQRSALELMLQGGGKLPENAQELARLATTMLDEKDLAKYAELAPGFAGHNTPEAIHKAASGLSRAYNLAALMVRRSYLGTWASTAKDILGNTLWLSVASDKLGTIAKGLTSYARGKGDKAVVALLEREGVLQSIADVHPVSGAARATEFIKNRPGAIAPVISGIGKGVEALGAKRIGQAIDKVGLGVGKPAEVMLRLRQHMDNAARYALYTERRARGFSHKDAVEEVFKFLGNFKDVATGKIEQKQLRAFFTFWTWNRKALGFAMRGAMDYPLRTKLMFLAAAGNAQTNNEVSRWARGRAGWMIGKDEQGNPQTLNFGPVTYMDPAWKLLNMQSLEEAANGNIGRAGTAFMNDVLASSMPMIAKPIELGMDTDTFTGNRITGAQRKEGRFADQAPPVLNWIPGVRELLGVRPSVVTDPDGTKRITHYTMNSFARWFMTFTMPGESTLAWQSSALGDERRNLAQTTVRTATGIPIYSMPDLAPDRQRVLKLHELQDTLRVTVEHDPDSPFKVSYGRLAIDKSTENGARIQKRLDSLNQAGKTGPEAMRGALSLDERWLAQYDLDQRIARASDRITAGLSAQQFSDKKLGIENLFKKANREDARAEKADNLNKLTREEARATQRRRAGLGR